MTQDLERKIEYCIKKINHYLSNKIDIMNVNGITIGLYDSLSQKSLYTYDEINKTYKLSILDIKHYYYKNHKCMQYINDYFNSMYLKIRSVYFMHREFSYTTQQLIERISINNELIEIVSIKRYITFDGNNNYNNYTLTFSLDKEYFDEVSEYFDNFAINERMKLTKQGQSMITLKEIN